MSISKLINEIKSRIDELEQYKFEKVLVPFHHGVFNKNFQNYDYYHQEIKENLQKMESAVLNENVSAIDFLSNKIFEQYNCLINSLNYLNIPDYSVKEPENIYFSNTPKSKNQLILKQQQVRKINEDINQLYNQLKETEDKNLYQDIFGKIANLEKDKQKLQDQIDLLEEKLSSFVKFI